MLTDLIREGMGKTSRVDTPKSALLGTVDHTVIVLTDYQEKKRNEVDWYSQPYFTHSHGYKMCVNVDLRSWYMDLRVYSYLLSGEYDDGLKWPFRGTVVVQLLNQLSDDHHHDFVFDYSEATDSQSQRVTTGKRSTCRPPSTPFPLLTDLDYNPTLKCQFLKNGRLTFKVVVKNL